MEKGKLAYKQETWASIVSKHGRDVAPPEATVISYVALREWQEAGSVTGRVGRLVGCYEWRGWVGTSAGHPGVPGRRRSYGRAGEHVFATGQVRLAWTPISRLPRGSSLDTTLPPSLCYVYSLLPFRITPPTLSPSLCNLYTLLAVFRVLHIAAVLQRSFSQLFSAGTLYSHRVSKSGPDPVRHRKTPVCGSGGHSLESAAVTSIWVLF